MLYLGSFYFPIGRCTIFVQIYVAQHTFTHLGSYLLLLSYLFLCSGFASECLEIGVELRCTSETSLVKQHLSCLQRVWAQGGDIYQKCALHLRVIEAVQGKS